MKPGWLDRELKAASREVLSWPEWMRREAGIANPGENIENTYRKALEDIAKCGDSWSSRRAEKALKFRGQS